MCGIAGFVSERSLPRSLLEAMAASLHHRGPDDEGAGLWEGGGPADGTGPAGRIGLAQKHLSILDLDLIDWVGGYPFEVARPEEVFDRLSGHGFELRRLKTCGGGLGCNEFVFRRKRTET